jgi:uncharacterized protein YjbI with pentapeptide repeats
MANQEHLAILKQGVDVWNEWRDEHPDIRPDLRQVNLSRANLRDAVFNKASFFYASLWQANLNGSTFTGVDLQRANITDNNSFYFIQNTSIDDKNTNLSGLDLRGINLTGAELSKANFEEADLSYSDFRNAWLDRTFLSTTTLRGANLSGLDLRGINLTGADLSGANLSGADLRGINLTGADLSGANLSGANLRRASLIGTNLTEAILTGCQIYGISVWDVQLEGAIQKNLIITSSDEPIITVDNLKVAQFIYLLLNNAEIRDVINTLTTKSVLILGRFTPERKAVLDALREALRQYDYLPILFDFDQPDTRDITETVTTLARLARFIIADLTDAMSIPQELAFIVPDLPSVPVKPILVNSQREYSMFEHFTKYPWVLPLHRYIDLNDLLASLKDQIIEPVEQKAKELEKQ